MYERRKVLEKFEEEKDFLQDKIQNGIEANRKGYCQFSFVDEKGEPIHNLHVSLKQKNHEFKFGANLFMLDELESEEKNEAYKSLFKGLFNLATIPFYWKDLEPTEGKPRYRKNSPKLYRRPAPDLCLEFCEQNGITPKAHCLNYDFWNPNWLSDDPYEIKQRLAAHFKELSEEYSGRIIPWEVTNETQWSIDHPYSTAFYHNPELIEWSFQTAEKYFPGNKLIINESSQIWEQFHYNRSLYYAQIERALLKGARIDSIGMQYHMMIRKEKEYDVTRPFYTPSNLYRVMDTYSLLNKPLQITEMTIPAYSNSEEDEALQAELLQTVYSIWFSQANMEAAIYWNLVDGYAAFAPQGDMTAGENYYYGGLVRFDLTPKPAYYALKKLIHETWHTEEALFTGETSNQLLFKGFYGDYEMVITDGEKTWHKEYHHRKPQMPEQIHRAKIIL